MTLTLELTASSAARPGDAQQRAFDEQGGTIGRASNNAWVLTHNKVSGHHALISFRNGVFYIEDTSRNGVSVNSPENRLVQSRPYALKTGDRIFIEPYEIGVWIQGEPGRRSALVASIRSPTWIRSRATGLRLAGGCRVARDSSGRRRRRSAPPDSGGGPRATKGRGAARSDRRSARAALSAAARRADGSARASAGGAGNSGRVQPPGRRILANRCRRRLRPRRVVRCRFCRRLESTRPPGDRAHSSGRAAGRGNAGAARGAPPPPMPPVASSAPPVVDVRLPTRWRPFLRGPRHPDRCPWRRSISTR